MTTPKKYLTLGSGIGLVAGSMIGTGVFVSAGYMAQDLSPSLILLAWVIGAAIAGAGALAYAELSVRVPRSGGEFRYISDLLHPSVGYLAGWASLLLGFSAPIAINALGASAFMDTLADVPDKLFAAGLIVIVTAAHAFDLKASKSFQDSLAWLKIVLVGGFIAVGLFLGESSWPTWSPPQAGSGFGSAAFMTGLFFVGFAYTGWNSAVYATEEFLRPARDVPRSMLIGAGLVALLYVAVNWVFVANLTPSQASAVTESDSVTLGHLVATSLLGDGGGRLMSIVVVLAFVSAMSAIMVIGPRVYAVMAEERLLPSALRFQGGKPPVGSVLFQGAIAIALLFIHSLRDVLLNASAVLALFSALAAAGLVRLALSKSLQRQHGKPRTLSVVAAAIYVAVSAWMLYFGFKEQATLAIWVAVVCVAGAGGYLLVRRR